MSHTAGLLCSGRVAVYTPHLHPPVRQQTQGCFHVEAIVRHAAVTGGALSSGQRSPLLSIRHTPRSSSGPACRAPSPLPSAAAGPALALERGPRSHTGPAVSRGHRRPSPTHTISPAPQAPTGREAGSRQWNLPHRCPVVKRLSGQRSVLSGFSRDSSGTRDIE